MEFEAPCVCTTKRKAQERIAALVQPSAIAELADQLDGLLVCEQRRT
jgi:hypothetical protein